MYHVIKGLEHKGESLLAHGDFLAACRDAQERSKDGCIYTVQSGRQSDGWFVVCNAVYQNGKGF